MSAPNTTMRRRSFLKYSAAAVGAAACLGGDWDTVGAAEPANLVLRNGKVITVDAADSIAQAVAIHGDEIMAVGSNAAIDLLTGPNTQVINLAGKTVTPGIIDAHLHALYYGRQFWEGFLNIRFPGIKSLSQLLAAIEARAQTTPAGGWISGNQGFYLTQGGGDFDKTELDAVAPNHPVYLRHGSGQYSIVNSQALTVAEIDKDGITTPNPFGGVIVRGPDGKPTGKLLHYPAENLVMLKADGYRDLSDETMENDIKRAQDLLLAAGITSVQDVIIGEPDHMRIYRNLAQRNELKLRVYMLLYINSEEQAQQYVEALHGNKSDFLTFGGWKLAIDGGPAAGTALMYDTSLPAARSAYYYYEPAMLNRIVKLLHETGLQISFHITGDKGIDEALDALEAAMGSSGGSASRHRIEHGLFIRPTSLQRIKDLGVVMSVQPQFITQFGDGYLAGTNEATMQYLMPFKTMLDEGVPLAFGCDVPAFPFHEPKWAFHGATLRRTALGNVYNPEQRLNMHQALRAHTMGSAYAAFEEDRKGSIEVGKLADLVVWNQDLYSMSDPEQFADLEAVMIIVSRTYTSYLPSVVRGRR